MAQPVISAPDRLAGLGLAESGRFEARAGGVSVRAYPFPYRAALAFSNDCDSMSMAAFEDWHAFVNGAGPTPNGEGLRLEAGDSFWAWAGGGKDVISLHRHYPDEPRVDAPDLGRLVELARLGWLDTMHSLGNWRPPAPGERVAATRDQAAYVLDRLDALGVKPTVFTNHSGSVSNVGGPWGHYQKADDPDHPYYCLDLMKAFGFRYFWIDACLNIEKFGDHLDYGTPEALRYAVETYRWAPWLRRRGPDGAVEPIGLEDGAEGRAQLAAFFNRLMFPVRAQDGSQVLAFKRQRGHDQPVMDTLCHQVTADDLDQLERMGGATVIYQHFGVTGPRGRAPAISKRQRARATPPVFDAHARARLRDIAERHHRGDLFVATSARLLDCLWRHDALQLTLDRAPERWVVGLDGFDCPVLGRRPAAEADLNGLSLLVPATAPEVTVTLDGRALETRRAADPANPGFHAVYRPWVPLEWPG